MKTSWGAVRSAPPSRVLRVLFERDALSPPPPFAPCTPEERGKALEEKTKNPDARIRIKWEKEFRKSYICVNFNSDFMPEKKSPCIQRNRCLVFKTIQRNRCIVFKTIQRNRCIVFKTIQRNRCIIFKTIQVDRCIVFDGSQKVAL